MSCKPTNSQVNFVSRSKNSLAIGTLSFIGDFVVHLLFHFKFDVLCLTGHFSENLTNWDKLTTRSNKLKRTLLKVETWLVEVEILFTKQMTSHCKQMSKNQKIREGNYAYHLKRQFPQERQERNPRFVGILKLCSNPNSVKCFSKTFQKSRSLTWEFSGVRE